MLCLRSESTLKKEKGLLTVNKNRNPKAQKAVAAHRVNLQKSLEHRLDIARANGDEALIRQLEQEANYLHLE